MTLSKRSRRRTPRGTRVRLFLERRGARQRAALSRIQLYEQHPRGEPRWPENNSRNSQNSLSMSVEAQLATLRTPANRMVVGSNPARGVEQAFSIAITLERRRAAAFEPRLRLSVRRGTFDRGQSPMDKKIDKSGWRSALDRLSQSLSGKRAEIEIAALSLGDQIAAERQPITSITVRSQIRHRRTYPRGVRPTLSLAPRC